MAMEHPLGWDRFLSLRIHATGAGEGLAGMLVSWGHQGGEAPKGAGHKLSLELAEELAGESVRGCAGQAGG